MVSQGVKVGHASWCRGENFCWGGGQLDYWRGCVRRVGLGHHRILYSVRGTKRQRQGKKTCWWAAFFATNLERPQMR